MARVAIFGGARVPAAAPTPADANAAGLAYALLAYGAWGLFPLFWKLLAQIPALELVAHRVTWACGAYLGLVLLRRRGRELALGFRDRATLRTIVPAALLVGVNWLVFIYAVATDRVLHASLGYFLNPLVSIVLGMVFLGERLRRAQWGAVGLAAVGVASLASLAEGVPWIGLVLAITFGGYGLLRKVAPVDGLLGAAIESVLLVPIAGLYLGWLALQGAGAMGRVDLGTDLLLVTAGLVTAAPLVWFANAARRLPLRTLGFLQYIAPTMQFALAVLVFGETLTPSTCAASRSSGRRWCCSRPSRGGSRDGLSSEIAGQAHPHVVPALPLSSCPGGAPEQGRVLVEPSPDPWPHDPRS